MLRAISAMLACLLLLAGCMGCSVSEKRVERTAFYFDTAVSITLYGGQEAWLDEAFAQCARYERIFSRTNAQSELYALNHADGQPMVCSDALVQVITAAVQYSTLSDGKFDVTIAPYSDLWDFTAQQPTLPDANALKAAGKRVGYENIQIKGNTVTLLSGAQLDLGGIAKGYIADRLAELLTEKGANAVLSLGGNVMLIGEKSNGAAYTVGIKNPENTAELAAKLRARGGLSVVTCGDYERCFTLDGVRYHHILDVSSGMPAESDLRAVTVIAPSSMQADALSTICFLLGEQAGKALIETLDGVEAVFVNQHNAVTCTDGIGDTDALSIEL